MKFCAERELSRTRCHDAGALARPGERPPPLPRGFAGPQQGESAAQGQSGERVVEGTLEVQYEDAPRSSRLTHFLEGRMDASFGTTSLAMQSAIRLIERGVVNPEEIISHRFPLQKIQGAAVPNKTACSQQEKEEKPGLDEDHEQIHIGI